MSSRKASDLFVECLEAEGVKVDGARVIITDRARLTHFVQPDLLLDGPDPVPSAGNLPLSEAE